MTIVTTATSAAHRPVHRPWLSSGAEKRHAIRRWSEWLTPRTVTRRVCTEHGVRSTAPPGGHRRTQETQAGPAESAPGNRDSGFRGSHPREGVAMSTKPKGIAARAGRWSAQHRKIAIFGWLAFVIAAFLIGNNLGTKKVEQTLPGESG